MKYSISRIFTTGLCAATLAACGEDGGLTAGATASESGPQTSSDTTSDNPTDPSQGSVSNSEGTTEQPTTGMSQGETQGTTEADTTGPDPSTTEAVTEANPECGNGVMEGGEQCDDGNQVEGDGCEPTCVNTPVCGNGTVDPGEVCDDNNTMDGDECSADCLTATPTAECGNGVTEPPEACDDGNQTPGDGCEDDCMISPPVCGNGKKEGDEQCDDGNQVNGGPGDFCLNNCTPFVPASCNAPAMYEVCDGGDAILTDKADKKNALRAIGICDLQPNNSIVTTAFEFDAQAANNTWQVARGFGTHMVDHDNDPNTPMQRLYSPREGESMLILSSGVISPPVNGVVTELPNSQVINNGTTNADVNTLPAPFKAVNGSNNGAGGTPFMSCDNGAGDNDCSDTIQAQWVEGNSNPEDRIYFTFKTVVPAGTFGYTFEFAFCSSEWPDWVGDGYNDLLIAYQVDPTPDNPNANPPVDPYSGNVTFIPNPNNPAQGLPITITALDSYFIQQGYTYNEPQMNGTGFEGHACSDWFTAKGGVQPGAEITVGFFFADMADANLASVTLLDNFRWDCEGCVPSEVDDCGVQPPM
ncbi:DUF4215 domain-containing protein [Nannocystis sp. SCPEA4]|uniref:DUF4215 domain-containing protein n=1 Tax=Nannocystis sp. SCPEA4 TaxID=2996787 RepID=UPI002270D143|nr:DUF4215 domain-containing protein [Nannocystis sp. SCPEA4]MCY1061155.1 DUF4215 domain-containing protein [Nannocystis sp. SCPEA4]